MADEINGRSDLATQCESVTTCIESMGQFLREAARVLLLLSGAEELALSELIQRCGALGAKEELTANHNLRLVVSIAKRCIQATTSMTLLPGPGRG